MADAAPTAARSPSSGKKVRLVAPCMNACPAEIDVPRYIGYLARGMFDEAEAVVRERLPFPAICGRVCYHPCEVQCRRDRVDGAVLIDALKRAAADYSTQKAWRQRWEEDVSPPSGKRIAVIGSGPAGLTAAYYLGKKGGHEVTVYEAEQEPGGELRLGIPEFRLPRDVMEREIELACRYRVNLVCNHRVESLDDLLAEGFDAVFIAAGAGEPKQLRVPGADLPQVIDALDFLHDLSRGRRFDAGEKVVVIGGGNSAIDASRTLLRLGVKEVRILYRRTRKEMPAMESEVDEAEREGILIDFLVAPTAVEQTPEGKLRIDLQRMELGEPDESGRQRPVPIPGDITTIIADSMFLAISQGPSIPEDWGLDLDSWGAIKTDSETLETSRKGVFAGGDVVTGPLAVVNAIAHGRLAAESIDRHLGGDGDMSETLAPADEVMGLHPNMPPRGTAPIEVTELDPVARIEAFDEVNPGLSADQAMEEACRCLRCDLWRIEGVPEVWRKKK